MTKEQEATVIEALDMFRPQLQADGGDMEFVSIDEQNRVHLRLTGACGSCPMALMTLKMGVERYLKDACPEVSEVVQELQGKNFKSPTGLLKLPVHFKYFSASFLFECDFTKALYKFFFIFKMGSKECSFSDSGFVIHN